MGLRESIKKNPAVGGVVAVAIFALAIGILLSQTNSGRPTGSGQAYFYDLKTGKLFTAKPQGMPPIDAPEGGPFMGAVAHVFSCGQCQGDELVVVAIETISPEAHKVQKQVQADPTSVAPEVIAQAMTTGNLIAPAPAPDSEPQWVVKSSPQGMEVLAKADTLCDGKAAELCSP